MTNAAKSLLMSLRKLNQEAGEKKFYETDLELVHGIRVPKTAYEELDDLGYIEYHPGVAPYLIFFPERAQNIN